MKVTRIPTDIVGNQNTIRIDLYENDALVLARILKIAMTVLGLFDTERRLARNLRSEIIRYEKGVQ